MTELIDDLEQCDGVFRDTKCHGTHHWVPIDNKNNCIYMCEYHATLFAMIMELHNIYTTERIEKLTTDEIISAWETAFGEGAKNEG